MTAARPTPLEYRLSAGENCDESNDFASHSPAARAPIDSAEKWRRWGTIALNRYKSLILVCGSPLRG